MPDIKEKLVELIGKAKEMYANDYTDHTEDDYIAETLLDNGVTIQKWISVEERLPDAYKRVIVHYSGGKIDTGFRLRYAGEFSLESVYGKATHWMLLPEPPKGE